MAADPERLAYIVAWAQANREKVRAASRRYKAANPEKVRELDRRYRAANREKARELDRRYRAANPEKVRERARRYKEANPEKVRASRRRGYHERQKKLKALRLANALPRGRVAQAALAFWMQQVGAGNVAPELARLTGRDRALAAWALFKASSAGST